MATPLTVLKEEFLKLKEEITALLDKENKGEYSYLQNYLYTTHYPVFSNAESVIILCENGKYNSASVLLRTLIEAHINIIFHQLDNSEYRLAISAKVLFDQKIKIHREIKELIGRHPNLESKDSTNLFSRPYLEKALQWSENQRQAIIKGNNLQPDESDLDLRSKAIRCDKEFKGIIEKGHFERIYTLIYRYLSRFTHLDIEGLQMFVKGTNVSEYSFHDGTNCEHLVVEAIDVYVALTKDLYDMGLIKGSRTETINRMEQLLRS